jgi:hypothetical protein
MTKGDDSLIIWIAILNIISVQSRDSERFFSDCSPQPSMPHEVSMCAHTILRVDDVTSFLKSKSINLASPIIYYR